MKSYQGERIRLVDNAGEPDPSRAWPGGHAGQSAGCASPVPAGPVPLLAALIVTIAVLACSTYANLAFAVKDPANYRFFPPFKPFVNANLNRGIGGEYYQIAKSMAAGDGFANPFKERTGPTAWTAPVLPTILAGLLWAFDGNPDAVAGVIVGLQAAVLIGTGFLVLVLTRQTTSRAGTWLAAAVYIFLMVRHFHAWFQRLTDGWLMLLMVDVLIAGWCWWRPFDRWRRAVAWGVFGGLCALVSPIIGFAWGMLALVAGCRQRAWSRLVVTMLGAVLTLAPWMIRNYLVFGRWIPVKSNMAYELYQSQCRQPDGLIQHNTFPSHPHMTAGRERQQYKTLGEMAFLDQKWQQFRQAVAADPVEFLKRVADRFLGATLWYVPFDRADEATRPGLLWVNRLIHFLPFLALLVLVSGRGPLHPAQWTVIGIYLFYLLPYVGISYYERYAMPLLGAKVLLVVWAVDRSRGMHFCGSKTVPFLAQGTSILCTKPRSQ
jgi:hypothetical protein